MLPRLLYIVVCALLITDGCSGQSAFQYPDSLMRPIIKCEPFAVFTQHIMVGAEWPIGKRIVFDLNAGVPVGLDLFDLHEGHYSGVLARVGIQSALKSSTPFSVLFIRPEVVLGFYQLVGAYKRPVNARAIIVSFGYRHLRQGGFYYELGLGLGTGHAYQEYDSVAFLLHTNGGLAFNMTLGMGVMLFNWKHSKR